jgi:Fic family protein
MRLLRGYHLNMLTLDPGRLARLAIPIGTGWLLGECMEARGKQELWIRQKPEVLDVLREQAIIQSAESSNRIEGVTVAANRLRPLLIGRARPRDRSEEELAGYRAALEWIFSRKTRVAITPDVIRRLHSLVQGGSGDASGERSLRFIPVSAKRTPAAMEVLCSRYNAVSNGEHVPGLLIVATFVLDFLCIHPFRDGNGRVSRLTTSLLLQSRGFQVSRYISLERLIEESKGEYYRVLKLCSQGWHEGKNEIVPWWNYFLSTLHSAYKEFELQVVSVQARPAKSDLVRQTILAQVEMFTLADMAAQLPAVSSQLIKKVLTEMKKAGKVRLVGRGRGARWGIIR